VPHHEDAVQDEELQVHVRPSSREGFMRLRSRMGTDKRQKEEKKSKLEKKEKRVKAQVATPVHSVKLSQLQHSSQRVEHPGEGWAWVRLVLVEQLREELP
jgi:hypothetical protein